MWGLSAIFLHVITFYGLDIALVCVQMSILVINTMCIGSLCSLCCGILVLSGSSVVDFHIL